MILTTLVVLAVVPLGGRYLVVEETDGTFYLPAGKVHAGEDLIAAAVRETLEEAGVPIVVQGLLGLDQEHLASPSPRAKLRFTFVGAASSSAALKDRADRHSRRGLWATRAEIERLPLRHPEVLAWIGRFESGAPLLRC